MHESEPQSQPEGTRAVLTCGQMLTFLIDNTPKLIDGGRLAKALKASGVDLPVTLISIAFKESRFDPAAKNDASTATGLFQCLAGTADDIQDRVVKNFLAEGAKIPNLSNEKPRFKALRDDPAAACFCAYAYLLDRIAANNNKLEAGISAFGTGEASYAPAVLKGVTAIRRVAGIADGEPTDPKKLAAACNDKDSAVKKALEEVF